MQTTIAICTGMTRNLDAVMRSVTCNPCDEILLVGHKGGEFLKNRYFDDKRVRLVYADRKDLLCKRKKALDDSTGEIIAYIDDDACAPPEWISHIKEGFSKDSSVGIVTGPSLLPSDATLWQRTAQLALASAPYSQRRYTQMNSDFVPWYSVIGANFSALTLALKGIDNWPEQFTNVGDDMAMAYIVANAGYKIYYSQNAYVYHPSHRFVPQMTQIYRFGKVRKDLSKIGARYPPLDLAWVFYMPVSALFAIFYLLGLIRGTLFPRNNTTYHTKSV